MTQKNTASELLAKIENDFFKDVDLAAGSVLEGDERRAFRLAQVERLLTEKHGPVALAVLLSDMFWTADEGRKEPEHPNPLLSLKEQQTLTDEERSRLRLILEVAGLCHDLSLHFTFDIDEAFGIKIKSLLGIKDNFSVGNKPLVEWVSTTEYERIAMHAAFIMRKFAIDVYVYGHYLPAQDELAELYSSEYKCLVGAPDRTKIPPRDYVKTILNALLQIDRHWQRGYRLKLKPDLVMLHDEIYGVVPRQFDKGVLAAAQALYDYMDKELYGRLVLKDYDYNASSWSEQPESVRRITAEVLNRFADKVREVRSEYLAKGWLADDSLEFAYLMAHAQNCGYGIWREEDDAL